jgi:hypothetical protein
VFELLRERSNKTTNPVKWQDLISIWNIFWKYSKDYILWVNHIPCFEECIIKFYGTIVLNKLEIVSNIWEWYIQLEVCMVYMGWDGWLKKLFGSKVLYSLDEIIIWKFSWFPCSFKQFDQQTKTKVFGGAIQHHFSTTTTDNASEEGSETKEA